MKTQTKNSRQKEGSDKEMKVENLDPFNMSDKEMKFAEDGVVKILRTDKKLYEKARAVVHQLKLGGLWRGDGASVLIVANAINEGYEKAMKQTQKVVYSSPDLKLEQMQSIMAQIAFENLKENEKEVTA